MSCALMYHDIVAADDGDASGFPGRDAALYKMTPDLFARHLAAIDRRITERSLPAPILTFDDGGVSAPQAADLLERYGFQGHFFITVNYIGRRGFLDRGAIRDLQQRGHIIGSHSCSHPLRMSRCSRRQLLDEWTASRLTLADITGTDIRIASVPGGEYARSVASAAA